MKKITRNYLNQLNYAKTLQIYRILEKKEQIILIPIENGWFIEIFTENMGGQ